VVQGAGGGTFQLAVAGANACNLLTRARDAGQISSVTISDRFQSSLHSLFVEEINGLRDNWVYQINGKTAPFGCTHPSAPAIKAGDTVTWRQS
jgi:hypothetical protein